MKTNPLKISFLALALAGGFYAGAQSNGIPGDTDYTGFSRFITDRNIFDPSRFPHETHTAIHHHTTHINSAPEFTLAGTMNYGKGWFAFFNGNNDELKQVLPVSGALAGYTVTDITLSGVTLQGKDKKVLAMPIGAQMQHGNNGWELVTNDLAAAGSSGGESASSSSGSSSYGSGSSSSAADSSAPATPPPSFGNNDVLKRLMQLREQENK